MTMLNRKLESVNVHPTIGLSIPKTAGLFAVLLIIIHAGLAAGAESNSLEAGKRLDLAREAWRKGDRLGQEARAGLLDERGSSEKNLKLLNEQSQAYDEALKCFSAALQLDEQHPNVLEEYGRFLFARGRCGAAGAFLERALFSPRAKNAFVPEERADILRQLAGVLERGGQGGRAANLYRKAFELSPGDLRNRISLAVGLCALGEPEAAYPALKAWVDTMSPGVAPTNPAQTALGYYTFGYVQEQLGKPEDAVTAYNQARKLAETAGAGDGAGVAEQAKLAARRVRGILRELAPDLNKLALAKLEGFLREQKSKDKALAERFEGLLTLTSEKGAMTAADALVPLVRELQQANNPMLAERVAGLVAELKAAQDARQRYAKAHWRCNEGLRLKNEALQDRKLFDAAVQKYITAPNEAAAELARLEGPVKLVFDAIQQYTSALQAWPKLARAHLELGACRLALGEVESAESHFDAAALYDPLAPAVLIRQAEVRFMLEDWDGSEAAFAKLAQVDPEFGPAYLGRARVAVKTGTTYRALELALDDLDRAERFGVASARLESVRKALRNLLERLDQGEKIRPVPGRQKGEIAAPKTIDPSKAFEGIQQNVFGP